MTARQTNNPAGAQAVGRPLNFAERFPLGMAVRLALPAAFPQTLCWFGAMTFVNLFITRGLGEPDKTWTTLSLPMIAACAAGGMFTSFLVPAIGGRPTMIMACLVGSAAYLLFAFTRNLVAIAIGLALCGWVAGTTMTTFYSLMLSAVRLPGVAVSLANVVLGLIAWALLIACGEWIALFGYRPTFLMCAGLMAVSGAAFLGLTHSVRNRFTLVPEQQIFALSRKEWKSLLTGPVLLLLLLGSFGEPLLYHTCNQLTANLFHTVYGKAEDYIGQVTGFSRLFTVVGGLTIGLAFEWLTPHRRWGLGVLMVGGCVIGMGMSGSPVGAICFLMAYQLIYVLIWCSNNVAIVEALGPTRRTIAISLLTTVMSAATVLVGALHRLLLGIWSAEPAAALIRVFVICGILGATCGLVIMLLRRPHPPRDVEPATVVPDQQ